MKIVLLTLLATFLIQVGYFIWKIEAAHLPQIGKVHIFIVLKGFLCNWKWVCGMLLRLLGLALFIKAASLGAISLVQPLMSVGDIFLILLAVIFLHERLARLEWAGLFLAIMGGVAISFEAKVLDTVAIDWHRVFIFLSLTVVTLVSLIVLGQRKRKPEVFWAIASGVAFGLAAVLVKLMTSSLTLSGLQVDLWNCLLSPIFIFFEVANITGLLLLQLAFQMGRAAVIIPVQLSIMNGIVLLAGIFLYFEPVSVSQLGSILLIVMGAGLLQYHAHGKTLEQTARI